MTPFYVGLLLGLSLFPLLLLASLVVWWAVSQGERLMDLFHTTRGGAGVALVFIIAFLTIPPALCQWFHWCWLLRVLAGKG